MKRLLVLLPLLVLLIGCSQEKPQQTQPDTHSETQDATQTTTESVSVDTAEPLASVQLESAESTGFTSMGADLLLIEADGLAILDAQTLEPVVTEKLQGLPKPDRGLIWTHADGVAYYDASGRSIVFLGTNLKETMRLQMPDDMMGVACLSPEWDTVYYCTASEIRALDMKNGISRLIKAHPAVRQTVSGVILDGAVLNCVEQDDSGKLQTVLISAQTGELLYEGTYLSNMVGDGANYYLTIDHESVQEIIFGSIDGGAQNLWTEQKPEWFKILPDRNAVVAACRVAEGIALDYYDLTSGRRSASVTLTGQQVLTSIVAETDGGIWILCGQTMYLWYPDLSPVEDPAVYTAPRYTRADPDTEGLAEIAARAQKLEQRYGVSFLLGESANHIAPWDYSFETEYIPQAYENTLSVLEQTMAQFPDTFFASAAEKSANRKLTIVLVRGIYGALEKGTLASAGGIQYWLDGNLYMVLSLAADVERFFYHEVGHIIDTKVLSAGTAFYEWEKLNPPGFAYDNDYIANQDRQDETYLQDADRWFIDTYSMSFAVEDRSRIFEYACFEGNEKYFTSATMQQKLQRVCQGIREVFHLEEDPRTFIWEQYLNR